MSSHTHGEQGDALVADYLARLRTAAADLPADRRDDLVGSLAEHLEVAREQARTDDVDDELAVRRALDRLGSPAAIVAAERGDEPPAAAPSTTRELVAVLLLSVGSLAVPLVAWLAGVALLWTSPLWTRRDKLLGTLVVPGGPVFGAALLSLAFNLFSVYGDPGAECTSEVVSSSGGQEGVAGALCAAEPLAPLVVVGLLFAVVVLAPFVVAVVLYRRARRRAGLR